MTPDPDQASTALAAIRAVEQAADPAPWTISARHGVDIADEGWSEVSIVTGDGAPVALTFLSHVLEPGRDEENAAFIVTARTAMPRLLAAVERVLELHQPGRVKVFGYTCKRHENHRFFSITRTEADDVRACRDCTATVYSSCTGCGPQVSVDACPVREAVTTALTGDSETGDHRTEAERRAADEALEALRERLAGDG